MNPEDRKDFTVAEIQNRHGKTQWAVMIARKYTHSICHTLDDANKMASNLNLDPYHYDRIVNNHRSKTYYDS